MDLAQIITIVTSVAGSLLLISRGLLELAKWTKTKKDDEILNKIIRFITKALEIMSGIKSSTQVNIGVKKK